MKNANNSAKQEVILEIKTSNHSVKCDGGGGALGHPAVYLEISPKAHHVICPYCSRKFVQTGGH